MNLKSVKKLLVVMFVFLLVMGVVPVQAATVKLSKAKATMEVDSTLTLKLNNASGKVTWKSSNKNIASVSKAGKVTAKKEGTATITAVYSGSNYKCTVTVVDSNKQDSKEQAKFDADAVAKKIKVTETYKYSDYWGWNNFQYIIAKNTSDYTVELTGKIKFYDENGDLIGFSSLTESVVGPDEQVCFSFDNDQSFASYDISWTVAESKYYSAVCKDISIETTKVKDKVIIEATNNGKRAAKFVDYTVLFFENGEIVDYDRGYLVDSDYEIKPGNSEMKEATSSKSFDTVKIYLSGRGNK